jgi:hypothetical protein
MALIAACSSGGSTSANNSPAPSAAPSSTGQSSEAPSASPPFAASAAATTRLSVGSPLTYHSGPYDSTRFTATITLDSIKTVTSLRNINPRRRPITPKVSRFVIVEITVDQTTGSSDLNPADYRIKTPDGTKYHYFDNIDASKSLHKTGIKTLPTESLKTGQKSHGYLVFDIPTGPSELDLTPPIFDEIGDWVIPGV